MDAQNIGIDLGLGFVKTTNGEVDFVFPSVVGAGQELTYHSELTTFVEPIDNMAITLDGKKYFIGELAIRQSEILSRSLSENPIQEKNTKILLLTALALYCDGPSATFNVITGLPPGFYLANRDDFTAMIQGSHQILWEVDGVPQEKTITVEKVKIIPQPMGTLFDSIFDGHGAMIGKELARAKVGIIDIGFRTTDFVMADRLEYIDKFSVTKTTAMSTVYGIISDHLHRQFHVYKENYDLEEIIRKAEIKVDGEVHSLDEFIKAAFEELTAKILTELNSIWDKRIFDTILLSGGGGAALADYLLPEFKTGILVNQSQASNVHGYLKLGHKVFGYTPTKKTYTYVRPEYEPILPDKDKEFLREDEGKAISQSVDRQETISKAEKEIPRKDEKSYEATSAHPHRLNKDKESFKMNLDTLFNPK